MKKTAIGGSALIEGLMMIGAANAAIAVRKPDGDIIVEKRPLTSGKKLSSIPVIRGVVSFFRQMILSMRAMIFSASFIEIDENEKKSSLDNLLEKIFGDRLRDAVVYISLVMSIGFSVCLFILLPNISAGLLRFDRNTYTGVLYYNFVEGVLRIILFLGYLFLVSRAKDIKRVWEYHGAEHKTINCYENDDQINIENVKKYSTKNPRCGTSYMFLVLITSILLFPFLGWYSIWLNVLVRLLLLPVVAGISYEIFKFSGRSESIPARVIRTPGLLLQMLTTKEPDERQIEVAIAAFENARSHDENADRW